MALDLENLYERLYAYCENEDFGGYDPFDGLNSRLFQATPLKHLALARLAWLQMIKRSPVELRGFLQIQKGVNSKGLALFALAELSRFRATRNRNNAERARVLIERLLAAKIAGKIGDGSATLAFGYNFDWQSRVFFAPVGTPAIVPTAFACQALVEAYKVLGDENYLAATGEICNFILHGLNRPVETDDEICFSYTPSDRGVIFNASLLAGESFAAVGALTQNRQYLDMAAKSARFVVRRQRPDGSWFYGADKKQAWVDNFHTAYVLLSLFRISSKIPDLRSETHDPLKNGVQYWLKNFFLDDGTPKYYNDAVYPVDIHSAAVAIAALSELNPIDSRMLPLARKIAEWSAANMMSNEGYFYYQKKGKRIVKTTFMRWGQAWMVYAIARLIETEINLKKVT